MTYYIHVYIYYTFISYARHLGSAVLQALSSGTPLLGGDIERSEPALLARFFCAHAATLLSELRTLLLAKGSAVSEMKRDASRRRAMSFDFLMSLYESLVSEAMHTSWLPESHAEGPFERLSELEAFKYSCAEASPCVGPVFTSDGPKLRPFRGFRRGFTWPEAVADVPSRLERAADASEEGEAASPSEA